MTREEAIIELEELKKYFYTGDFACIGAVRFDAFETAIKALEQQPKTGHWEYVQYDYNPDLGNWHCSECRGICTEMHSIEDAYNYCPNCGTKMEVEEC